MDNRALLKLAVEAALAAGEEILKVYETDFYVETKSDNTPVTQADKNSSAVILKKLSPSHFPVICEEERLVDYEARRTWTEFWLVDPLDGTKEFVKRNGEFTINIALIKNEKPIIGIIYAPILKQIYFAASQLGSFKLSFETEIPTVIDDTLLKQAQKLPLQKVPKNYTVIASRSHLSREVNAHIDTLKNVYGIVDMISVGSSIKQCLVAEGKAHEYPRFGITMEWDTAAGQCILEESGNALIDLSTQLPMRYNKENMQNNYFIAKHKF